MGGLSRRSVLVSGLGIVSVGCLGPDPSEETSPTQDPGDEEEDGLDAEQLDRLLDVVEDGSTHIADAAETFALWEEDPDAVDWGTFDDLRADTTALLSEYWRDVTPYQEELADLEDPEGEELADLVDTHVSLLGEIEHAAVALQEAQGDPASVSERHREGIELVIDSHEDVVEETEAILAADLTTA